MDVKEWNDVVKEDLPNDFFVKGKYEFQWDNGYDKPLGDRWCECGLAPIQIITHLSQSTVTRKFQFRETEPEPLSHTEIINSGYWKCYDGVWRTIIAYNPKSHYPYIFSGKDTEWGVTAKWFTDRSSFHTPPEAEK